jgi:hypothetical protein
MFESYVDGKRFAIMEQTENRPLSSIFRIILNHWPLLTRSARFVKPFINELEPNLILKGDSHHVCKIIKLSTNLICIYLVLCLFL